MFGHWETSKPNPESERRPGEKNHDSLMLGKFIRDIGEVKGNKERTGINWIFVPLHSWKTSVTKPPADQAKTKVSPSIKRRLGQSAPENSDARRSVGKGYKTTLVCTS